MTHILKNKNIEIHIDSPTKGYKSSRFDWTGKITTVKFQNIPLSSIERADGIDENLIGKGFYNEFGMDTALGFEEAKIGEWFHKIGVGLLKKDTVDYRFMHQYKVKPATFNIESNANKVSISCKAELVNGYSYVLKKEIEIKNNGFTINYYLENTGEKDICTEEYNHNFIAINKELINSNYQLKFPFQLKPTLFGEQVNTEQKVEIGNKHIGFNASPKEQFFFSNLSGNELVNASWELRNLNAKIGIKEACTFETDKINVWGWQHVISPELFIKIALKPGQSKEWARNYTVFKVN